MSSKNRGLSPKQNLALIEVGSSETDTESRGLGHNRPPAETPDDRRKIRVGPLDTVGGITREMGRIFRQCRRGTVPLEDGTRYVYILTQIRQSIEQGEFERRLDALEEARPSA